MVESQKMLERDITPRQLKESLNRAGILGVGFDLDDTLLDTHPQFSGWMRRFVNSSIEKSGLDWRVVWDKFNELNDASFATHFVRQDRLLHAAGKLDEHFGTGSLFSNHSDFLKAIYFTTPKMFKGTPAVLETFLETGLSMALVTHAEVKWTELKIERNGLRKYFPPENVVIAYAGRFKSWEDWLEAANRLNLEPQQMLAVGDNVDGDILAAKKAGVRYTILIESAWKSYRKGAIPKDTIEIKNISEVIPAAMNLI